MDATRPSMHINLAEAWLVIIVVSILILPHNVPGGINWPLWFLQPFPIWGKLAENVKQYFHCSEALFFPSLLCKHFHCTQLSWKKKKRLLGEAASLRSRVERSSPYHQFRLRKDETGRLACSYLPHPAQAGDQVPGTKGGG